MGNRPTQLLQRKPSELVDQSNSNLNRQCKCIASLSKRERALLHDVWELFEANNLTVKTISDAWLVAFGMAPSWLLGAIGFDEPLHSLAANNYRYQSIIIQATQFLHNLIKNSKLEPTVVYEQSYALGERHRNYIDFDNQTAYWQSFPIAFAQVIAQKYDELQRTMNNSDSNSTSLICLQSSSSTDADIIEKVSSIESIAHRFITNVVDAMQCGYDGSSVPTVLPVRRSLTNTVIGRMRRRKSNNHSRSLDMHYKLFESMGIANERARLNEIKSRTLDEPL